MPSTRLRTIPRLAGLAVLALALPTLAQQGTPRSIAECERLKNDLAYNQCLSMFGPSAKNIGGGDSAARAMPDLPPSAPAMLPGAVEAATEEPTRSRRGRQARRGGRQSASFAVGAGEEAGEAPPSRRRYRRRR